MTSDERIIENLRQARALIEQGWCQHVDKITYKDNGETCYCSVGALLAVREDQSYFYALDALCHVIDPGNWYESGLLPRWNDHPDRTKEDVLSAFAAAIQLIERRAREFPSEI